MLSWTTTSQRLQPTAHVTCCSVSCSRLSCLQPFSVLCVHLRVCVLFLGCAVLLSSPAQSALSCCFSSFAYQQMDTPVSYSFRRYDASPAGSFLRAFRDLLHKPADLYCAWILASPRLRAWLLTGGFGVDFIADFVLEFHFALYRRACFAALRDCRSGGAALRDVGSRSALLFATGLRPCSSRKIQMAFGRSASRIASRFRHHGLSAIQFATF